MNDDAFATPDPPIHLLAAFSDAFPEAAPTWLMRAPGREMWIAATHGNGEQFTLAAPDMAGKATFSLQSARLKKTVLQRPLPWWARYPAGVLLALDEFGLPVIGLSMVVMGSEPPGPRFDYGVGIAVATLWHEVHEQAFTIDKLIEIVDRARRDYVEAG